jgi:hypothetical protein
MRLQNKNGPVNARLILKRRAPARPACMNRSLYQSTVLAFGDAITRSINPMFTFTIIATVALTVLAYVKRN